MAVYKEEKTNTWRAVYRYTDWNGERKQTQKDVYKRQMYNGLNYYVLFKTSDTTEWSTDPISLAPGETKTVLLYIGEEYEIYYSIDITRPERPQIIGQPQDTAVTEGEAAAFAVEATGGSLTYQWQQSTDAVSYTHLLTQIKQTMCFSFSRE